MNPDKIKEIVNKIPITLILLVYLLSLGYDYYSFENDDSSVKIAKERELKGIKDSNAKLTAKYNELQKFVKTLEQKKLEVRRLALDLQDVKAGLPEIIDIPAFMKMVLTEAKKVGLTVVSLKPKGSVNQEYYVEQTFLLSFHGIFGQFVAFVDRLSNLTQIIQIDNFKLKTSGSGVGRFVLLDGEVELKTFRYLGSKADTLGKSESSSDRSGDHSGAEGAGRSNSQ